MAATIITVAQIGASGINIKIKINDGHPVPNDIAIDSIQSFRTWMVDKNHLFTWTNAQGQVVQMIVPREYIGWVMATKPIDSEGDHCSIGVPCTISIETELLI